MNDSQSKIMIFKLVRLGKAQILNRFLIGIQFKHIYSL